MKLKYIFALAACMATLAACTREGTMPTEGVPHGEGLAVKLLHSHYEGNPSSKGTYGETGETGAFDRVEIMVADEEGNRTGDIKYMYDKSSSTVHVEGLVPGSYQLLTLGIKGDWQKDSVTIYSIASTSQTWLAFPEDLDRPLEAEYFYSKTPFRVSVQDGKATADMPSSISLQRMTGRADFRFRYRNPYVETAVQSATVTMRAPKFMTELSGDGQFSGESLGNDIILGTHERQEFLFPPAVRQETLYGEAEVVCRTYRGGNSRNVYSFTLEPVRENRISTVEVDASNPEDGTGTMFITAAAYEKGRYKAILQDDEPYSIYTDHTQRNFNTSRPLQISVTDSGKLSVRFYSPRALEDVLVRARFGATGGEYVDIAYFDRIPAFADFIETLPCMEKGMTYRSETGRIVEIPALETTDLAGIEFRTESGDPYWEKLQKIVHGWNIRFSLYGGNPDETDGGPSGNWMGIRPVHCREAVALFLNFTYMIDMPEHEKILRENEDILYGNGGKDDKVTAETVLSQMRQERTLNVGLVYTGNGVLGLGGGNVFGAYQGGWLEHYSSAYACSVMFHELGHVMGYSHSSSFTYGPCAEQLMNNFYVTHISEMPVDSPDYLDSRNNTHLYK